MADIPSDLFYTKEHEYLKPTDEEGVYAIGITDYAQGELGDVVFVELPGVGDDLGKMETFGTVEAVKAVSDVYSPISGEVVAVNEALDEDPALVNSDPYGDGWMVKVRLSDEGEMDDLMSAADYESHISDAS